MDNSNFLIRLLREPSFRGAVAGDGLGNLEITDRPNWIYARLGDANGNIVEVHTSSVRPNYDDYFYIVREIPFRLGGWRSVFWLRDGSDGTLPAPIPGSDRVRQLLLDSDGIQLVDSDGQYLED